MVGYNAAFLMLAGVALIPLILVLAAMPDLRCVPSQIRCCTCPQRPLFRSGIQSKLHRMRNQVFALEFGLCRSAGVVGPFDPLEPPPHFSTF
jgi:hypothetical protein